MPDLPTLDFSGHHGANPETNQQPGSILWQQGPALDQPASISWPDVSTLLTIMLKITFHDVRAFLATVVSEFSVLTVPYWEPGHLNSLS